MYNGSIINESATLAFNVKNNLTGGAFTAVKLSDTGVATAAAGDIPVGILTAEHELPIVTADEVTVQIKGITLWIVGENVAAGDLLATGADGVAMKATAGKFILAQALSNGTTGEAIQVQIIKAGYAA